MMKIQDLRKIHKKYLQSFFKREEGILFCSEAKQALSLMPDEFIQTIYFDPPFSEKSFNNIAHDSDKQLNDLDRSIWHIDDKKSFLEEIKPIVAEFKRVLKTNGSLFIHLPWDLAYDVKPIADDIFKDSGGLNNEIIWSYRKQPDKKTKEVLQINHQTIFWYCKNKKKCLYNEQTMPKAKSTLKRFGEEKQFSEFDKTSKKRKPTVVSGKSTDTKLNDVWVWDADKNNWQFDSDEIDEFSYVQRQIASISHTSPNTKLKKISDNKSYRFEKPLKLLERLIKMSSNEKDIILDFFAGTGVSAEAAKNLNRKYIVADISQKTVLDIVKRLSYKHYVPGIPLMSQFSTCKNNPGDLNKIDGNELEFWVSYSLKGVSDDSFRGQDSIKGVDGVIPVNGEYFFCEVKKKLTKDSDWLLIKGKTEELFNSDEYKNLQKKFVVLAIEISEAIEYKMKLEKNITFIPMRIFDKIPELEIIDELNEILKNAS